MLPDQCNARMREKEVSYSRKGDDEGISPCEQNSDAERTSAANVEKVLSGDDGGWKYSQGV